MSLIRSGVHPSVLNPLISSKCIKSIDVVWLQAMDSIKKLKY